MSSSKFCDTCVEYHSVHLTEDEKQEQSNKVDTVNLISLTTFKLMKNMYTEYLHERCDKFRFFIDLLHIQMSEADRYFINEYGKFHFKFSELMNLLEDEKIKVTKCVQYASSALLFCKSIVRQLNSLFDDVKKLNQLVSMRMCHYASTRTSNHVIVISTKEKVKIVKPTVEKKEMMDSTMEIKCTICDEEDYDQHCVFDCKHSMCITCVNGHFASNTSGKKAHHTCHICRQDITNLTLFSKKESDAEQKLAEFCEFK